MISKAMLYTGLALSVASIVAAHIYVGNRRVTFSALLLVLLGAAAAPHMSGIWPGGPFQRVTINTFDLLLLVMWGWVLVPQSGRGLRARVTDSDFDRAIPTSPAPLRAVNDD